MLQNNIKEILKDCKNIAIVGAKDKPNQPVDRVGRYLLERGFTVYPIHPIRQNVWGLQTFKSLAELAQYLKTNAIQLDIICLFRAPEYCLDHAKEAFENALFPKLFWLQEGIKSEETFNYIQNNKEDNKVTYTEDVCIKTEYQFFYPEEFACSRCGICCSGENGIIVDNNTDLPRLLSYFNIHKDELDSKYTKIHNSKRVLRSGADKNCLFFVDGKGCSIHEARPDVCRAWPYFRGNIIDQTSLEMAKSDCKGLIKKSLHKNFQKEGIAYLKEHNLFKDPNDVSSANTLKYSKKELEDINEGAVI